MATETKSDERYRAPALDKGLDILELLATQPYGMTRGEIVKAMGRGPSEIYRMLERLVARDYVSRSAEGDRYALTMKLFVLGSRHPPVRRLVARAQPLMDAFSRATRQSCHLVAPDRGTGVVVAQASAPANWEFRLRPGASLDLISTASGLTLLAFQTPEGRAEILAPRGGHGDDAALQAIDASLQKIRRSGYRVGASLQVVGVEDISVPIMAMSRGAVAVITCPYLQRLEGDGGSGTDIEATLSLLRDLATKLSIA